MEIVIKTAEEFWRDKVSIQISGTAAEVQEVGQRMVRGREPGYWADACEKADRRVHELAEERGELLRQIGAAQQARTIETKRANDAEEALDEFKRQTMDAVNKANEREKELEAQVDRFRRAHVCTDRCEPNAHVAFEGRQLLQEAETERDTVLEKVAELRGEVRRLTEEMGRRFTSAEVEAAKEGARADARAEAERELAKMADLLGKVSGLALGSEVRRALEYLPAEPGTHAHMVSVALRRIRELLGVTWSGTSV